MWRYMVNLRSLTTFMSSWIVAAPGPVAAAWAACTPISPLRILAWTRLLHSQTNPIEPQSGTVRLLARVQVTGPKAKTMIQLSRWSRPTPPTDQRSVEEMTQAKWLRLMSASKEPQPSHEHVFSDRGRLTICGDPPLHQKLYGSHSKFQAETYLHSTLLVSNRS